MPWIISYFVTAIVMAVLDLTWIRLSGPGIYHAEIGSLLTDDPNVVAACLFYILYPMGILLFAVSNGQRLGHWTGALLFGALFGLFVYATYDLTNLAILKGWTLRVSIADMIWGVVVTSTSASAGYLALRWMRN